MKISQISIFKLPKKNLNAYQQIMLLENLTSLLSNGFTLLECFNFINLYFKYKDKQLDTKIIKNINNLCKIIINDLEIVRVKNIIFKNDKNIFLSK